MAAREPLGEAAPHALPKWHKEVKPLFSDIVHNAAILRRGADIGGQPVFVFAFDFKYFFHQIAYASADLWQLGGVVPDWKEGGGAAASVSCMSEEAMAMGFTVSSQIAQRLANAIMQAFSIELEKREAVFSALESEATKAWLRARTALAGDDYGSQARLFDCACYTDDPLLMVIGVERAVRALKLWHSMVGPSGLNLAYAKDHKWQAGHKVVWLGAALSPALGLAWVPPNKVVRAVSEMAAAREGSLDVQHYRKLLGFVEHILGIMQLNEDVLGLLYAPIHVPNVEADLEAKVTLGGEAQGVLLRITRRLLNKPCVSLLSSVRPDESAWSGRSWVLWSDAAVEPDMPVQIGGVCYGFYWYLEVCGAVTIPVAEFMAAIVNLIQHMHLLYTAKHVLLEVDALATTWALRRQHAGCKGMRAVLAEALDLEEVVQLMAKEGGLSSKHTAGEGNVLADAASRGQLHLLERMYKALGMRAQRLEVNARAIGFIERVLVRLGVSAEIRQGRSCDPAQPGGTAFRFVSWYSDAEELESDVACYGDIGSAAGDLETAAALARKEGSPCRGAQTAQASAARVAAGPMPPVWRGPARLAFADEPLDVVPERRAQPSKPTSLPSLSEGERWTTSSSGAGQAFPHRLPGQKAWLPSMCAGEGSPAGKAQRPQAVAATRLQAAIEHVELRVEADALVEQLSKQLGSTAYGLGEERGEGAHAPISNVIGLVSKMMATGACAEAVIARCALPAVGELRGKVQSQYNELRRASRERRVQELVALMRDGESEYSLHYDDNDEMLECIAEAVDAMDDGSASGTVVNEASNFRHWLSFCDERQTKVIRDRPFVIGDDVYKQEVQVMLEALLHIYKNMRKRPGYASPPRVQSAVNVLRGVRRHHLRLRLPFVDLKVVAAAANALTRKYIEVNGYRAMLTRRAPPYQVHEIVAQLHLQDDRLLNSKPFKRQSLSGRSFRSVVATMAQCGFRGDEVSLGAGKKFNGKTCISYANVRWWFGAYLPGGNVKDWVANPSADQLAGLKDGDLVMIIPPPSKADRFGTSWGNAPCYLEYSSSAGINAARELAQLELHHQQIGAAREATPLFRTDDGGAFTRSELAIWVRDSLLCTGVERERAAQLTLHSYRRYLACALLAMGCSGDQICALLRWKSQKSLAAYAALNPQAYAKMAASAEGAEVSSVMTSRLPVYEKEEVLRAFSAGAAALEKEAARLDTDLGDCADDADFEEW